MVLLPLTFAFFVNQLGLRVSLLPRRALREDTIIKVAFNQVLKDQETCPHSRMSQISQTRNPGVAFTRPTFPLMFVKL